MAIPLKKDLVIIWLQTLQSSLRSEAGGKLSRVSQSIVCFRLYRSNFKTMTFNSQQEKSLEAFITALSQQDDALPAGLQAQLQAIGQNLESRVMELPGIAASLPNLNNAYQAALADAQSDQEESGATFVSTASKDSSSKMGDRAAKILADPNPVEAAQRKISPSIGQIASNPLKRFFGRG